MHRIKSFTLGLILGVAFTAAAAQFTINIPDAVVQRVVDAWSIGRGWTAKSGVSKTKFAKKQIRNIIKDQVVNYEATLAQSTQWNQTDADTDGIDIP